VELIANRVSEFRGASTPCFLHFEIPNPEFPIALRTGPMVLAPGHKKGGLREGRFHFHLAKGSELILRRGALYSADSSPMRFGSRYLLRMDKGERGWVKPRVTHLLQSMEVPVEIYPGGPLVPVLFRKVTPSLQLTRGTCTRQFNIQRAQLPPGMSHAELKVAYDRAMQARFD
jgi:hypothetical protein